MEQHLNLYRNHTKGCIHQLRKPTFEGGTSVPDCNCPLNAEGRLRNVLNGDGTLKRIQHRTLGSRNNPCRDWVEARRKRDQWLEWGRFTPPETNPEKVTNPTVEQAVDFFIEYSEKTEQRACATRDKYDVFFNRRLLPWCRSQGKRLIREFDKPLVVKNFYASWVNVQPERGKGVVLNSTVPLSPSTKGHELERYRSFLEFAKSNGWVKENYAKRPHIKTPKIPKVKRKTGFNENEWERIKIVLDEWEERYYKTNQGHKERQRAFTWAARLLGQRLSDISMLGPHSIVEDKGNFFVELTQIKTGSQVKVPLDAELYEMLMAVPIYGRTDTPFSLVRSHGKIPYGDSFWFWTANVPEGATQEKINQMVESAAKNWSDDLSSVIKKTEEQFGPFEKHSTPHCFRHSFAITALNNGVDIWQVAEWMGDTVETIQKHYTNANSDHHRKSHAEYQRIAAALKGGKRAKGRVVKFQNEKGKRKSGVPLRSKTG